MQSRSQPISNDGHASPRLNPVIASVLGLVACAVPAQAKTIEIDIEDLAFSPTEIDASVGDVVQWVNKDIVDHTATANGGFDVTIPAGTSASIDLRNAGAVDYFCRFHRKSD